MKKEKAILIQLAFLIDVAGPVRQFLLLFASERPQIHICFHAIKDMLTGLIKTFKQLYVVTGVSRKALKTVDVHKKKSFKIRRD